MDPKETWGYCTNGGTEGNMYGLFLAREIYPKGIVYYFKDVKRYNEKITFYNMVDNERPNEKGVYCTIDKREANCNDFSLRYLEFNFFYGPLCIGNPDSVPSDMIKKFSWKNN